MTYQSDHLTQIIIECIIQVHKTLGPGFLESIYRKSLVFELRSRNLSVEVEKEVLIFYKENEVGCHRMDLIVQTKS